MVWIPDDIWEAQQKAKGKGGGKGGKGKDGGGETWQYKEAIEGLTEALKVAFKPALLEEPGLDLNDAIKKMMPKIVKATGKFTKDERASLRGSNTAAQALVEEFVESMWGTICSPFHEKPWLPKLEMTAPMLILILHTFGSAKIFSRTLAPALERFVQESIERVREEERMQASMWEAIEHSGVTEVYKKKANQHLKNSFEDAHLKAPWGSTQADTPELAVLQDFVKGWMSAFAERAWDVIENGCNSSSKDEQVLFLTVLFQNLTDATSVCVPLEIQKSLDGMPTAPWGFIAEAAEAVMKEVEEAAAQPSKKKQKQGATGSK